MLKNLKRESFTGRRTLRLLTLSSRFGLRSKETGKDFSQFSVLQRISELSFQTTPEDLSKSTMLSEK